MRFPMGEPVTVLTADTDENAYADEATPTWSKPPVSSVVVLGVGVEPRPSSEPVANARNAVVVGYTLYLPDAAGVTARSRIIVRGNTYEVLGEPAEWRSPFTAWAPGAVVQVQRVEG